MLCSGCVCIPTKIAHELANSTIFAVATSMPCWGSSSALPPERHLDEECKKGDQRQHTVTFVPPQSPERRDRPSAPIYRRKQACALKDACTTLRSHESIRHSHRDECATAGISPEPEGTMMVNTGSTLRITLLLRFASLFSPKRSGLATLTFTSYTRTPS